MSLARFVLGVALLAACVGPVALGAWRARARVLPAWSGAPARVAEAILAIAALLLVAQALGIAGLFSIVPVVLGSLAAGAGMWAWGGRPAARPRGGDPAGTVMPAPDASPPAPPTPLWARLVAVGVTAILVADWTPRIVDALRRGMSGIDTLWYHLPVAARFVQDGSITALQYVDDDAVTVFYPANTALFHGIGMLAFGDDVLSPVMNLGWLALALAAAWCIGRPFGVGPASLAGVAVVFALPGLATTQPGGAYNDVAGIALLLAAAAVVVQAGLTRPAIALAATAGGVAVGIKFTLLAPVGALALGVVVFAPRGRRLYATGWWVAAILACSGVWYVRNLVAVGNPLPSLGLGFLPSPPTHHPVFTIAEFLGDRSAWHTYFLPGLETAFGPAWWAMLALAVAGMVVAVLLPASRAVRMLGAVALVAGAAYIVTPQFLGIAGKPLFFVYNLRYAAPALVLGLALLPVVPRLAPERRLAITLGAFGATLLGTQFDPSLWPTDLRRRRFVEPIHGRTAEGLLAGLAVAAAGVAWTLRGRLPRPGRRAIALAAAVIGAGVIVVGWRASDGYVALRYRTDPFLPRIYTWAQGVQHQRIGVVGTNLQYPLTGPHQSNRVQYLGRRGGDGSFGPYRTCRAWRAAINDGRYGWVLVAPLGFPVAGPGHDPETRWTASDPGAHLVTRDRIITGAVAGLYRIDRPLDPATCPRGAAGRRSGAGGGGSLISG